MFVLSDMNNYKTVSLKTCVPSRDKLWFQSFIKIVDEKKIYEKTFNMRQKCNCNNYFFKYTVPFD